MSSVRQNKIGRLIQKELASLFQQERVTLFGNAFITVTSVRMSPDMSFAKVFVSIFVPGKLKEDVLEMVRSKSSEIRKRIGNNVRHQLRIVPEMAFFIDDSLDYSERIDELLKPSK